MNITEASKIVINDTRESYPDMSDADSLAHAYNTVGISQIDASNLEVARAYHIVLNAMSSLVDDPRGPRLTVQAASHEVAAV